jgi:hypothetical protein
LFREHCTFSSGVYVKDLKRLNRDLKDVIIIDNSPLAFHFDVDNGLPISSFTDDKNDKELFKLDFILESLAQVNDVRQYIPLFIHGQEIDFNKAKDLFLVDKRHLDSHPPALKCHSMNYLDDFRLESKNSEGMNYFQTETIQTENDKIDERNIEGNCQKPTCTEGITTKCTDTKKEKASAPISSETNNINSGDDRKHHKSKTISSILVRSFGIPNKSTVNNSIKHTNVNSLNLKSQTEEKESTPASLHESSAGTGKQYLSSGILNNNGLNFNYLSSQDKSRSKNKLLNKNKNLEHGAFYNNSTHSKNSASKQRGSFVYSGSTSSTTNSKRSSDNIYMPKSLLYERKVNNYSVESRLKKYDHNLVSSGSKTLNRSLNKSNIRENSKTSLQSKYSKKTVNVKINKVSRNFKLDTPVSKSNKSLKSTSVTAQYKNYSTSKSGNINQKFSTTISNSTKINNKILGVKVFQVNKIASLTQGMKMPISYGINNSKSKYSPFKNIHNFSQSRQNQKSSLSKQSTGKSKDKSVISTTPSLKPYHQNLLNNGCLNYTTKNTSNSSNTGFNNINVIKIGSTGK